MVSKFLFREQFPNFANSTPPPSRDNKLEDTRHIEILTAIVEFILPVVTVLVVVAHPSHGDTLAPLSALELV